MLSIPSIRVALVLLAFALGSASCTKATVIGTACTTQSDCNVTDQVCAPGFAGGPSICTRKCTIQTGATGCPIGYDCFATDPAQGRTCNKSLYEVDAMTGKPLLIGRDCGLDNAVCTSLGSTNSAPSCRKVPDESEDPPVPVELDPNAYCTGACNADTDCPFQYTCDTDYDMKKKCLRRTLCAACTIDENCPNDFPLCVPTKDGSSRYCTKACTYDGECGGAQNTALTCAPTKSASGADVQACLHRFGACVGDGNVCDPCRKQADCAKSNTSCAFNSATGERMCTKQCRTDTDCSASGTVKAVCDNTDVYDSKTNPGGMSSLLCNGDVAHATPGLFSCWVL